MKMDGGRRDAALQTHVGPELQLLMAVVDGDGSGEVVVGQTHVVPLG